MKLLFYLTRFPAVGGIENVTVQIVNKLSEFGYEIDVVSHSTNHTALDIHTNVNVFHMPDEGKYHTKANVEYADSLFETGRYDAIIYQDSYAPTESIVCEGAKKHNIPLYVFEHNSPLFIYNKRDLSPFYTCKGFLRRILHPYLLMHERKRKRYLLNSSRKYVLLSSSYIPEFCSITGTPVDDERLVFINNPVRKFTKVNIPKERIILCVCRLTKEKQVEMILDIWNSVSSILLDWELVVVGDGPERDKLEKYAESNKVERITFTGFLDPSDYYQKSKIFVMTSKYEGLALTLVEALSCGCVPVVWNSFSSLKDVIDDQTNGFVIENGDKTKFKSAVVELASDEEKWQEMSESAITKSHQFDIDIIIKQWLRLLS